MSSDNASSVVTYMSISSDGQSWGIPLMDVDELPEMDPYEEVAQQGQAPPLSPAYVHDPMELEEHVPVNVPEPIHLEYHVPSNDDMQVEDQPYADDASPTAESPGYIADSESILKDSIDYPDEPKDDDEDPEEDPSEEHEPKDDDEDPEEDPSEEHEPEDEDTKEEEPSEGFDETDPFEEDKTDVTPPPPGHRERDNSVRHSDTMALLCQHPWRHALLSHRAAMIRMRDDIPEEDMPHQRRFILTAPPPGCDIAESSVVAAARLPRGQYDFIDTVEAGQGLIRSPGHDARTIARAADKAEDVGYVRALQASKHRMMTSIEEVNLRIDVVRGHRTVYETELHEGTEGVVGLYQWLKKMESVFYISGCTVDNQVKFATCTLLGVSLTWWNGHVRTLGHDDAYAMTWGTLKK
ncbi:hypothetical protein Tco_1353886 [Tanacetum coccineum]